MARRIKLMSEYGADWPLWGDDGLLDPEDLDLSSGLNAGLKAWQDHFDAEFHWNTGWRTREAEERYAREAAGLLHRLRTEVGSDVEVALDAWPVTEPVLTTWLEHRQVP